MMCLAVPCSALTLALSYSQMDVGVEQDPVFSFSAGIQKYFLDAMASLDLGYGSQSVRIIL